MVFPGVFVVFSYAFFRGLVFNLKIRAIRKYVMFEGRFNMLKVMGWAGMVDGMGAILPVFGAVVNLAHLGMYGLNTWDAKRITYV